MTENKKETFFTILSVLSIVLVSSLLLFTLFKKELEYIPKFTLEIDKNTELYNSLSEKLNVVGGSVDYTIAKLEYYESVIVVEEDSLKDNQARYNIINLGIDNKACPFMNVSLNKEGIIIKPFREKKSKYSKSFVEKCAIEIIKNIPTEKIDTQSPSLKEKINSWN